MKENLECVIDKEEMVLDGMVLIVLVVFYYKVLGWFVSFGNDKKVEKLFKCVFEVNLYGMD